MALLANIALGIALILVLFTIGAGLVRFAQAGGTDASKSNIWMRRRVIAQFIAVGALCLFAYLMGLADQ